MNWYLTPSQIPELRGFNRQQRRLIGRSAQYLMRREDPWFFPSAVWLFATSVGFWGFIAIAVSQIYESRLGLWRSVAVGFAVVILPAAITAFAHSQVVISRLRPFLDRARKESEAELRAG